MTTPCSSCGVPAGNLCMTKGKAKTINPSRSHIPRLRAYWRSAPEGCILSGVINREETT